MSDAELGRRMHCLCSDLFPLCRSITGSGLRETLSHLRQHVPEFKVHEVPTGERCFDWVVPREWNIREAWVRGPSGRKVIDFEQSNLHVVGYSTPVDKVLSLDELQKHLHSLPDRPDAIPYVTSYYEERWGFCMTERQRQQLRPGDYHVRIDSELKDGALNYAEAILPGETQEEVLLSSYVCHPSMANNELSGPVVTTFLAKWLTSLPTRRFTYRIVLAPETIGSIAYISRNLTTLRERVVAGFVLTCIGDDRAYSYLPSQNGGTLADRVAVHTLKHTHPAYVTYSFRDRGSDERQYCSPGVDLPVCSIMRSKYGVYPEYHTSDDDLNLVTPDGLLGGYEVVKHCIECIEANVTYRATFPCEPQLGRRGLYPTLSTRGSGTSARPMMDLLAYADGKHSLLKIAELLETPMWELVPLAAQLIDAGVLEVEI